MSPTVETRTIPNRALFDSNAGVDETSIVVVDQRRIERNRDFLNSDPIVSAALDRIQDRFSDMRVTIISKKQPHSRKRGATSTANADNDGGLVSRDGAATMYQHELKKHEDEQKAQESGTEKRKREEAQSSDILKSERDDENTNGSAEAASEASAGIAGTAMQAWVDATFLPLVPDIIRADTLMGAIAFTTFEKGRYRFIRVLHESMVTFAYEIHQVDGSWRMVGLKRGCGTEVDPNVHVIATTIPAFSQSSSEMAPVVSKCSTLLTSFEEISAIRESQLRQDQISAQNMFPVQHVQHGSSKDLEASTFLDGDGRNAHDEMMYHKDEVDAEQFNEEVEQETARAVDSRMVPPYIFRIPPRHQVAPQHTSRTRSDLSALEAQRWELVCAKMAVPKSLVLSANAAGGGGGHDSAGNASLTFDVMDHTINALRKKLLSVFATMYHALYPEDAGHIEFEIELESVIDKGDMREAMMDGIILPEKHAEMFAKRARIPMQYVQKHPKPLQLMSMDASGQGGGSGNGGASGVRSDVSADDGKKKKKKEEENEKKESPTKKAKTEPKGKEDVKAEVSKKPKAADKDKDKESVKKSTDDAKEKKDKKSKSR